MAMSKVVRADMRQVTPAVITIVGCLSFLLAAQYELALFFVGMNAVVLFPI